MARVYCAGPLFNTPEREEMAAISNLLESSKHQTYLPQRDGLEASQLAKNLEQDAGGRVEGRSIHYRSIFLLDVYKLLSWSDVVVANLNGRVPDEGTVVECALAWHSGKALILYKNDERAPFTGIDNPMLIGLTEGPLVDDINNLPLSIDNALLADRSQRITATITAGERIGEFIEASQSIKELSKSIVNFISIKHSY